MSATNPSPLPQAPEVEPLPQLVALPGTPGQPRKPSVGLTAGLWLVASLVTALAMWALANRGLDTSSGSGAGSQARLAVATGGELLKSLRVGGTIETLNYAAIRVPRLRGPRDSGRADLTIMSLAPAGSIVKAGATVAEFELKWLVDHIEDRESITNRARSNLKKRIADVQILDERILPDLSASVDVRASNRPKGVLVPREALRNAAGEASSFVFVHSDGQFLRREVRVQDVSDTEALIETGLQAGEEILLSGLPVRTEGY